MSAYQALKNFFEFIKAENRPCEAEAVHAVELALEEDNNLAKKIKEHMDKTPYYILPKGYPEIFEVAGYEIRSRSITDSGDGNWGKYFPCSEQEYNDCLAMPFRNGWQHEARKLYVEVNPFTVSEKSKVCFPKEALEILKNPPTFPFPLIPFDESGLYC